MYRDAIQINALVTERRKERNSYRWKRVPARDRTWQSRMHYVREMQQRLRVRPTYYVSRTGNGKDKTTRGH